MDIASIQITAEITPNPHTLKFVVNRVLVHGSGGVDFTDRGQAEASPLASRLFENPQVAGVFIGSNFVTVTKLPEADWNALITPVVNTIRSVLTAGGTVVQEGAEQKPMDEPSDPTARRIREILDREIRPAVAMDGGDITFLDYKDGVVTLHLRGSCSACPSSIMTLKMGVENRLKSEIPEIKEVIQVN